MGFSYPKFDKDGIKVLSRIDGKNAFAGMDITVYKLKEGDALELFERDMETAVLLVGGALSLSYQDKTAKISRKSWFEELPSALHVCRGVKVTLTADTDSEIIVESAENGREFASKLYLPADIQSFVSCEGKWENTAVRDVVTVFDYGNAPYSNMVLGEVFARQGRWWSYIPHNHPQPEVYYYKFQRPEGFGACFIGEVAHTVKDGSVGAFPGGYNHPQVTAPGYPMYCCWMIRHLPGNPWTDRIDDPRYKWLTGK